MGMCAQTQGTVIDLSKGLTMEMILYRSGQVKVAIAASCGLVRGLHGVTGFNSFAKYRSVLQRMTSRAEAV